MEEIEKMEDDDACTHVKANLARRILVSDVLNFFEEMSYAARSGVADLNTLKNMSKSVVERYYSKIEPWIDSYRKEKFQPTAYEHFEWLRNQWKSG